MIISSFILIVIIIVAWIMGVVVGLFGTEILKVIFGDPICYVEDDSKKEYEYKMKKMYEKLKRLESESEDEN